MKKSERLLEAVGMIDEKHLPDPESILKKQADNNIQEYYAEMTISDGKKKKSPFKWAAFGTAACAAAVAGAIFLNNSFVTDKDGIYKELLWESRGENLELLPVQTYFDFGGLEAHDISEIGNDNPWSEDLQLETLPVFRNKGYSRDGEYTPCLTDEQMAEMAEKAVKALGLEAESRQFDGVSTSRFVYGEETNQCRILCNGEKYGTEKVLVTVDDRGNITVKFGLEEYIYTRDYMGETDESFVLPLSPNEYRVPHEVFTNFSTAVGQTVKGYEYLTEYFKDLIMYKNPAVSVSFSPMYNATEMCCGYFAWDRGDNIRESILNYSFANTRFSGASPYPNEEQQLQFITINNTLSVQGEYVGDYPLTSVREAKEKLLSGKYTFDYRGIDVPPLDESSIKKAELVYFTDPYDDGEVNKQEYFMPYYCFYAEKPSKTENEDGTYNYNEGLYDYDRYYVPAVSAEYLDPLVQSDDRLFKPLVWETNTENLVDIPAEPFRERGSGTVASDISMIENSNPWTEDISLDRMPVFLNKAYGGTSPEGASCLSDKEMQRAADLAAKMLGVTIDESKFVNFWNDPTQPPDTFYAYCNGSNYGTEQVRISVSSTGTVYIRFDRRDCIDAIADEGQVHECYTLPEGYYCTDGVYPDDLEQESKTMWYLAEQFSELMNYDDPQLMLNIRSYYDGSGQWFFAYFTDKGKDTVEDILNYNFKATTFGFNPTSDSVRAPDADRQLFSIITGDMLATQAEYLGDYPIITAEQAKALLLSDKYSEYFSEYNITADSIKRVEGEYVKSNDCKYFQPYYCIYVETPHENGMKEYIKYYIPAIDSDGYAAEGALNASDPVFPKTQWDTATGMETNLESNYDLDYSNYFAHNVSEVGNQNNPWNESLELETLPVFLNMNYGKQNGDGYVLLLTEEEMIQTAERAANKLGVTIEDTNVVYAVSNDMPIELTAVCNGEKYGVEQIKILVHGSGDTVDIRFGEKEGGANYNTEEQCYQLPEGYKLPCSVNPGLGTTESQEEDEKAINLMYERFKALTGYDNPEIAVSNMPHYSNSTLTEYKLWDKDEDIVRNILNYNLTGVKFFPKGYDQKQLWEIELSNSLYTSHYAGDYPTITVQEAKEKLLERLAIVPPGYAIPVITEDQIEKTELIYGNTKTKKYIMPYYRFYVRSENEAEGMEGYYQYSQYYVPAIWDMYLEDMSDKRIYNEVSSYWYKTENLPQITSRFTFHGSGADGFNALYLRSEEQIANSDIWQREFELTEAAVFRNLAFNADRPYEQCYFDAEEMERMARAAANALGASIVGEELETFGTADSTPAVLTVKLDIPHVELPAVLTVKPCGDLSIVFGIDENRVPVGINYNFDISDEAGLRETAEYLKNWYSELIQYVEADTDLVYNTDNKRYDLYTHQHSEDVVRNMINRYLNNVYFGLRETEEGGVLTEIAFYNRLCTAEYLGDYPLVSYDEAVELLLNGDYRSYVKKSKLKDGVISEADILYGELVYNNGKESEYFQPYYKFYVELNETADWFEHREDEKAYGVFWVPAVVEEYRGTEKFLGADEWFLEEIYGEEGQ